MKGQRAIPAIHLGRGTTKMRIKKARTKLIRANKITKY